MSNSVNERVPLNFEGEFSYNLQYKDYYDKLVWKLKKGYEASPFKGKLFADVFICSFALGFSQNKFVPFHGKKSKGGIPGSAIKERGQILVMSVAVIHERNLDILYDTSKVYSIAENYANGGFPELLEMVVSKYTIGTPIARLEARIYEELNKLKANKAKIAEKSLEELSPFTLVTDLENRLRALITNKLESISTNWLRDRVQPAILENWQEKAKAKNERQIIEGSELPLINYSDLGHLKDIILRRDNWKEKFSEVFRDEKMFESQITLIIPIRNMIMHGNEAYLNDSQVRILKSGYEIITSYLKRAEK